MPRPCRLLPILACVLALLAAGCRSSAPAPAPARQLTRVTIGIGEDYPEETATLDRVREDFRLLRGMGIDLMRVSIGWDGVERERDVYDWAFWDGFFDLADEHGIRVIPYVCYTPRWIASETGEDNYWRSPPRDDAEFAQFMRDVATRYRGRVESWEIWNEPDNPQYWTGDAERFAALLKAGAAAVRQADPRVRIVLGGIAWDTDFLAELLRDHGVAPSIDVVNLHNYFETWSAEPVERIDDYINEAHAIVHEHGEGEPLWMAEIGYSSYRHGNYVSEAYTAKRPYEHTREYQAVHLVKALSLVLATEKVELITWYRLRDLPHDENVIGDANNHHLGVVNPNGSPKPAFHSLKMMADLFSEPYEAVYGAERPGEPQTLSFVLGQAANRVLQIVWSPHEAVYADPPHATIDASSDASVFEWDEQTGQCRERARGVRRREVRVRLEAPASDVIIVEYQSP